MSNDTAALAALTARMVAWTPSSGSASTQHAPEPALETATTDDQTAPAAMETERDPSPVAQPNGAASPPSQAPIPTVPDDAMETDAPAPAEDTIAPSPAAAAMPPVTPPANVDVEMDDTLPQETTSPAPPAADEDADEETEYDVEAILDSKRVRGKVKYLVKWAGHDEKSWESVENVVGAEEALAEFHTKHPLKPNHATPPAAEDDVVYEVQQILDSKRVRNKVKYLVQWTAGDQTWEPVENLGTAKEAIAAFRRKQRRKPQPTPAAEGAEYEVKEILDSKVARGNFKYLVQWTAGDQTWEPVENLEAADEAIAAFHRKHPRKPRPPAAEEAEYEVDKILDSKRVRNKVKYLVQWTAGDQTWEPVENLAGAEGSLDAFHAKHPGKPSDQPAADAEEAAYEVEEIRDSKRVGKGVKYLVKWAGYDEETWEPVGNLDADEALDKFHKRYPKKPRAASVRSTALQPSSSNLRAPQFGKISGIPHDVEERLLGALQRCAVKFNYWDNDEASLDGLATKVAQSYGHKGNYATAKLLKVAKRHANVIKP